MYAWRRDVHIPSDTDARDYLSNLLEYLEQPAAPSTSKRITPLHSMTLDATGRLGDAKRERLEMLLQNPEFRRTLTATLAAAVQLQAPLYVGKAINLQQRIAQHVMPMSDLSVRLRECGISLDSCILAYRTLDDETTMFGPDSIPLIEEVLTYLCRPGFVIRPG